MLNDALIKQIGSTRPVLIAGPTASGKSALALSIAKMSGGVIINADALQVFDGWRVLTARPDDAELAQAPHELYGHVPLSHDYSVGHWLRDVAKLLDRSRPIIVGGTGLYLSALTEGLADIPPTPPETRAQADNMTLKGMLAELDPQTSAKIDTLNRARVQRAWEVQSSTGKPLSVWQSETPPPLLPLSSVTPIVLDAPPEWLTPRINLRFDQMLEGGALEEARRIEPNWDPGHLSSKAIGAAELIGYLRGECSLEEARDAAVIGTRQYAKRQRTWFRSRMRDWHRISPA